MITRGQTGNEYLRSATSTHSNIGSKGVKINLNLLLGMLDAGSEELIGGNGRLRRHLGRGEVQLIGLVSLCQRLVIGVEYGLGIR